MRIVAFGHRTRAGKDTAAKFLISAIRANYRGIRVKRVGLADELKALCHRAYHWAGLEDMIYYENHPEKKDQLLATLGKTPRQVWLEMGFYYHKVFPTTMCQCALAGQSADILIIPDLRRKVEADFLRMFRDCWLVEIHRPDAPKIEQIYHGHPAYTLDDELTDYPFWNQKLDNSGDLKAFNKIVCDFAQIAIAGIGR